MSGREIKIKDHKNKFKKERKNEKARKSGKAKEHHH
jgi:hypothetical protein